MGTTGRYGKDRVNQAGVVGTEGGRRPTGVPTTPRVAASGDGVLASVHDTEVTEAPMRRQFTAEYKLRILQEADQCSESGQLGALLRREGLYSSNLTTWRRQRDAGTLNALAPKKRGRKVKPVDPMLQENQQLRRELERLRHELSKAHTIIEVQKKISRMLGAPIETPSVNGTNE